MSKRRQGFPSETAVKRGDRVVGGTRELVEKLGRNNPCPCGSARSFQALLFAQRLLLTASTATTIGVDRSFDRHDAAVNRRQPPGLRPSTVIARQ
jgi:hypothetical protein